jgi:hypothetical protein
MSKSSLPRDTILAHQGISPASSNRQQPSPQANPRRGGTRYRAIPNDLLPRASPPAAQRNVSADADHRAYMLGLIDHALALLDDDFEDEPHPQVGGGDEAKEANCDAGNGV